MTTTRVYSYSGCSTCKKALKWLTEHSVEHEPIDIVTTPPSVAELERMWRASGKEMRALFNVSGQSYREGGFKDKLPKLSAADALSALAADGKLIKRPLLHRAQQSGDVVLVGFREDEWRSALL